MDWSALPPMNALRAFAAVAETRSLTRAAELLNVTRPAISQQVRNLEIHYGERLLVRQRRGIALTSQGETLARSLHSAFAEIAAASEKLSHKEAIRPLHVSTTPMFASSFLVPQLAAFRDAHPGIELMVSPTSELVELIPGGIDVAIRYGTGEWPGVDSEFLFQGSFAVVASVSLIGDRSIEEPADILDYPILQELGSQEFSDWMAKEGIEPRKDTKITRMPGNLLLDGLRRGDGIVATVPRFIEDDIADGRIRVLFEDRLDAGYHIVTHPGVRRPPLKAFIKWLYAIS